MTGESRKMTVLVIDDDRMVADTLAEILRLNGFSPVALYSGEEAISFTERFQPDVVLSDIRMHRVDGIEAARAIRQRHPECRVILFTASTVNSKTKQAIQRSGFELLQRPLHPQSVLSALRQQSL
ncbi:MAG TPA: response regulator [Terracidiphilus sp.]|jgi:DNA-binding NtrC family response regulator